MQFIVHTKATASTNEVNGWGGGPYTFLASFS